MVNSVQHLIQHVYYAELQVMQCKTNAQANSAWHKSVRLKLHYVINQFKHDVPNIQWAVGLFWPLLGGNFFNSGKWLKPENH